MNALVIYGLAAPLYVTGGVFMKYSAGLTRWLPELALVALFSAGALMQASAMKREPLGSSYVVDLVSKLCSRFSPGTSFSPNR